MTHTHAGRALFPPGPDLPVHPEPRSCGTTALAAFSALASFRIVRRDQHPAVTRQAVDDSVQDETHDQLLPRLRCGLPRRVGRPAGPTATAELSPMRSRMGRRRSAADANVAPRPPAPGALLSRHQGGLPHPRSGQAKPPGAGRNSQSPIPVRASNAGPARRGLLGHVPACIQQGRARAGRPESLSLLRQQPGWGIRRADDGVQQRVEGDRSPKGCSQSRPVNPLHAVWAGTSTSRTASHTSSSPTARSG